MVEALDEKGVSEQLLMATYSADHKETFDIHVWTMTTKGKALRVVQQADLGNGYLAWLRLRDGNGSSSCGRLLGVLQTLLAVRFWERNVLLYEQQSGEDKRAVLQKSLPADLRQALQSKTNIDSADFREALR